MKRALLGGWFVLVALLALFSRWYVFGQRAEHCSLDGGRIVPIYRVDMLVGGELTASFCCLRCASEWPAVPAGARWNVRDEVSGRVIDSGKASFVRSSVVTVAARQDRTHVFENWPDASGHAAEYGGERIANPLMPGRARMTTDPAHDDDTEN